MILKFLKNIGLSFDSNEDTGYDYKKLTAFWGVIVSTFLLFCYAVQKVEVWCFGIRFILREDLTEFKWILGIMLSFILILVYFQNSKDLSKFVIKMKNSKESLDEKKDE